MTDDPQAQPHSPVRYHDHLQVVTRAEAALDTDPQLAMRLLEELPDTRSRRAEPGVHGRAAYIRALILRDRGQYDRALDTLRAARHDLVAAGLTVRALATELGRASILREAGDAQRSVDIMTEMIDSLARVTVEPDERGLLASLRAQAREQLAEGFAALGNHAAAITQYDLAWNAFHGLGDQARMARVEGSRAVSYLNQRMLHRALGDLQRACEKLRDLGHHAAAARFAIPTARTLTLLGRLGEARTLLEEARAYSVAHDATPQLADIHLAASEVLLRAGRGFDARVEAEAAIDLYVQLGRVDGSAEARYIVGMAHWMAGKADAASAHFDVAERLFAHQRNIAGLANVALAKGAAAYAYPGNEHRAAEWSTTALERARESGDDVLIARALLLKVGAASELHVAETVLAEAERMLEEREIDGLDLQLDFARAHLDRRRGDAVTAAGRLRAALARHGDAHSGTAAPRSVTHPRMLTYAQDELIDVLLEIGTHEATIEAWQTASARQVHERLGHPTNARSHERSLEREMQNQALSDAIERVAQSGALDLDGAEARHLAHWLERQAPTRLPAPKVVGGLPIPEGPLVQYHVVHNSIVAFVIREGLIHVRRLPASTAEVSARLNEWYAECSRIAHLERHHRTDLTTDPESDALRLLGDILIDPLADLLEDLVGSELVVVPHRQLHGVPFEALRLHGRPLYTAFGLRFSRGPHDPASFEPEAPLAASPGAAMVLLNPDSLAPRIADEADEIRRVRPDASILVGAAANSIVLANLAASHDLVHIACHGFFWPEHPAWSALRLGDRWVTAAEIANMDMQGCLVVLNACATGQGRDTATETVGLVWALLAAGCRGVVCTTWPVDDELALAFTTAFHTHLANGLSPAEAVRRANHAIARNTFAHPWAWAAYRYVEAGSLVAGEAA